ncbi:MAG: hypothetical protein GMKNLPBB_00980 [Myxococcota bacterium]|nr:hypothetical protein [Myxococcota bacterium]
MAKLLIVDDDPGFLEYVRLASQRLGLEMQGFTRPEDFLSFVDGGVADIAIIDGLLPKMDGMKLLSQLKGHPNRPRRIIFLSHFFKDLKSHQQIQQLGADVILHKPITFDRLCSELENLVRK